MFVVCCYVLFVFVCWRVSFHVCCLLFDSFLFVERYSSLCVCYFILAIVFFFWLCGRCFCFFVVSCLLVDMW